jgi:hypothetical protein
MTLRFCFDPSGREVTEVQYWRDGKLAHARIAGWVNSTEASRVIGVPLRRMISSPHPQRT